METSNVAVPASDAVAVAKPAKPAKAKATKKEKPAKPAKASIASKPKADAVRDAVASVTGGKTRDVVTYRIPSYDVFDGDDSVATPGMSEVCKGAYSLAVLIVAGMIKVSPKGTITRTGKGHSNMIAAMSKALHKKMRTGGNHKHAVLYDADGYVAGREVFQLNAAGQVFFQNRNNDSGPAFNTESKYALEFAPLLRDGKPLFAKGCMSKPVALLKNKPVKVRA